MGPNLVFYLTLVCCVAYAQAQLVGGLHDERQPDEEVRHVVRNIHQDFEKLSKREYKSIEVISYRKQIVAGANYFIKALATHKDGAKSHVHLRVYKPFRGPLELSAIRLDVDREKPLEYFD